MSVLSCILFSCTDSGLAMSRYLYKGLYQRFNSVVSGRMLCWSRQKSLCADGQREEWNGLLTENSRPSLFFGTETSCVTKNIYVQILNQVTEFISKFSFLLLSHKVRENKILGSRKFLDGLNNYETVSRNCLLLRILSSRTSSKKSVIKIYAHMVYLK